MRHAFALGLAILLAACVEEPKPEQDAGPIEKARTLHEAVLTLDSHIDIPPDFATRDVDPGQRGEEQVDLLKMADGGLDGGFFIVYVPQGPRTPEGYSDAKAQAIQKFDAIHRMAETMYPGEIEIAYSAADVQRIVKGGKRFALIGIENGYVIGRDLDLLDAYYARGARYMTLAHVGHNDICDSSMPKAELGDEPEEHGGLSEFGRAAVERMNRLGMAIDVSHISRKAMLDAIRASKAPVIASHSGARALSDHPRNLDDEQLAALKDSGGVMQIVAYDAYLKRRPPEKDAAIDALLAEFGVKSPEELRRYEKARREEFRARRAALDDKWPRATIRDFADHIDYAVAKIGADHVGIASDFGGGGGVLGWDDASESGNVTLELVRRGYGEDEIAGFWGGNLLRVLGVVERAAEQLRAASPSGRP